MKQCLIAVLGSDGAVHDFKGVWWQYGHSHLPFALLIDQLLMIVNWACVTLKNVCTFCFLNGCGSLSISYCVYVHLFIYLFCGSGEDSLDGLMSHRCPLTPSLSPRKRTTSQSKTEPPFLRTNKRTIYTAGRPPWYNVTGTTFKEAFVIGTTYACLLFDHHKSVLLCNVQWIITFVNSLWKHCTIRRLSRKLSGYI